MNRDRDESGFTLVELLVATVVSGIIIGGIASILIVTLQSYPRSAAKLTVSDNAQLLSSWLVPDVQSADGTASGIQAPPVNNSGCATQGIAAIDKLRLSWSDAATPASTYAADYCVVGSELIRYYQQGGTAVTRTVVSRDLAAGGVVVLTGSSPANGDGPTVPTADSVDIKVTTTDLVNGTPYQFHVSASRRTPALRIFPVPDINIAGAGDPGLVNGTAPPNATVGLSITDEAVAPSPSHTIGPQVITAGADGKWTDPKITWTSLNDGLVTFSVQSTDANGHRSTATTTAFKDTTAPTAIVTLVSPVHNAPTHNLPLVFRVRFSEHLKTAPNGQALVKIPPGNPGEHTSVTQEGSCPAGSAVASECFKITVDNLNTTNDQGDGPVSVSVPVGAVADDSGNPNSVASNTVVVQWDLNPPIVVVTPQSPSPTSTDGLVFLATVSKATSEGLSSTDVTITPPKAGSPPLTASVVAATPPTPCPAPSECFTITVTGLQSTDGAGGPVRVTVKADSVTDAQGLTNTTDVVSDPIVWAPLTIHEAGPATAATFTGVAGPGTLTVSLCTDTSCAAPAPLQQPAVGTDGTWNTDPAPLNGATYAEAVQTLSGVTTRVTVGLPA